MYSNGIYKIVLWPTLSLNRLSKPCKMITMILALRCNQNATVALQNKTHQISVKRLLKYYFNKISIEMWHLNDIFVIDMSP